MPHGSGLPDTDGHLELSTADVQHIATLARIGLTDADVERFRIDLSSILRPIRGLQRIDTTEVEPTAGGLEAHNVFREDVARPSSPSEEILANAAGRTEDGLIRVRAVLDT